MKTGLHGNDVFLHFVYSLCGIKKLLCDIFIAIVFDYFQNLLKSSHAMTTTHEYDVVDGLGDLRANCAVWPVNTLLANYVSKRERARSSNLHGASRLRRRAQC